MNLRRPSPGSLVDIVAPSGPFDPVAFADGVAMIAAMGLSPRYREDIFARDHYLAGSDHRRLDELRAALASSDSDLVWAARGGFGATRIVERLPLEEIRAAGKVLVGFSDITALHLRWREAGVPSVHGSMVARLAREPEAVQERMQALLMDGAAPSLVGEAMVPGVGEGPLAGGNLALLAASCGTPLQPNLEGCVLFLEDVGERPYRLDRMLVQCAQAGLFKGVQALALGEFYECDEEDGRTTSRHVLREFVQRLGLPTVAGLPCGHGSINLALPLGRRVRVEQSRLLFLEPLYGETAGA